MHEVRCNPKAQNVLAGLHRRDPATADRIEDVLDLLESDPEACQHEPYPHERGAAFVAQVVGTRWYVAWIYSPGEPDVVQVGRIDEIDLQ